MSKDPRRSPKLDKYLGKLVTLKFVKRLGDPRIVSGTLGWSGKDQPPFDMYYIQPLLRARIVFRKSHVLRIIKVENEEVKQ